MWLYQGEIDWYVQNYLRPKKHRVERIGDEYEETHAYGECLDLLFA